MTDALSAEETRDVEAILTGLGDAWARGDGAGFAAGFA